MKANATMLLKIKAWILPDWAKATICMKTKYLCFQSHDIYEK